VDVWHRVWVGRGPEFETHGVHNFAIYFPSTIGSGTHLTGEVGAGGTHLTGGVGAGEAHMSGGVGGTHM
jgi:hypothetical protein